MSAPRPTPLNIPDRAEYGPAEPGGPARSTAWDDVAARLDDARYFWLCTSGPGGRPHAVPVWAVWLEPALWFATSPRTATARNLARDARTLAHPESAFHAVVLHGSAALRLPAPREVVDAYERKYGWRLGAEDPEMPFFALHAERAESWDASDIRGTATRWTFDRE